MSNPAPVVPGPEIRLDGEVITGPNGKPWIRYEFTVGIAAFALSVPVEVAKQLPAMWATITDQVAAKVPPAGLILPAGAGGLVIATPTA